MRRHSLLLSAGCWIFFCFNASATVFYVDVNCTNPVPPYADWSTASTDIQSAIDAATDGDQILVTNGIYQMGGKAMSGNLTNRIALNKAVCVQSFNGPWATVIQGAGPTNGNSAIRCAWLTNGAVLAGFTVQGGATRTFGGDDLSSGGGIWCASSNAIVENCLILSNTAESHGGGTFQGRINNSLFMGNGNPFAEEVGAAYFANLDNCTIVSNRAYAVFGSYLTNCIVYYNGINYDNSLVPSLFSYCCTTPAPGGTMNFTNAPQLFADGIHLSTGSPCIGQGTNIAQGTDIFGNAWGNPPSIGCAEATGKPLVTNPELNLTSVPIGFIVDNISLSGQSPFTFQWLKDGLPLQDNGHFSSTQTTNLIATSVDYADAGNYEIVVSNSFGKATSAAAQLTIHCVDITSTNSVAPFLNWGTAATNIQDAVTVSAANDVVLVTNGLYTGGGKSMEGLITNRVSLDKAILVQSLNGPSMTIIQGAIDPISTNGYGAIRCAWMTNNAILSGFTIRGGATRNWISPALPNQSMNGGGVYGTSNNAVVYNCTIQGNFASWNAGGAYQVTLSNSLLIGNQCGGTGNPNTGNAGGAYLCNLNNCMLNSNIALDNGGGTEKCNAMNCEFTKNRAVFYGSGAYQGSLVNCTLVNNTSGGYGAYGGAVASATLTNCVVYLNSNIGPGSTNYVICTFSYSDSDPLPVGLGNIDVNPKFLADDLHLQSNSPCINAGNNSPVRVTLDLDGDPRIVGGTVDIGAYEYQTPSSVLSYAWAQQYGLPTDGTADYVDSDGDGMNNWQEWIAGTNPTNAASVLALYCPAITNSIGITATWQSVSGVTYYLQSSTNLSAQPAFTSIQNNIVGQAGTTSYTDNTATNGGPYFYRVGVQLQ
jgi:hypothetical protein